MIKASLKFYGTKQGPYGIPIPYHSYFVFSSPWKIPQSGIASVISLSASTPMPDPPHAITDKDGEEGAYRLVLEKLRALSGNQGLSELLHREPDGA